MKRFKYQGLVTLHAADEGKPCPELGRAPRRMVMRAWDEETGRSQLFSTLVSCEVDGPWPGGHRIPVTLRVAGDDVADYLGVGRDFVLWLEGGVGEGMVTGRVFLPI